MTELTIEFYKKEPKDNGTVECPVTEFLDSLSPKMRAKVLRTVELLKKLGSELRLPYSESLKDGILELRVKFGSDITRVLYFFVIGNKVVLTHGFVKKTQKTPPEEIERAKKYRTDYLNRIHTAQKQKK